MMTVIITRKPKEGMDEAYPTVVELVRVRVIGQGDVGVGRARICQRRIDLVLVLLGVGVVMGRVCDDGGRRRRRRRDEVLAKVVEVIALLVVEAVRRVGIVVWKAAVVVDVLLLLVGGEGGSGGGRVVWGRTGRPRVVDVGVRDARRQRR